MFLNIFNKNNYPKVKVIIFLMTLIITIFFFYFSTDNRYIFIHLMYFPLILAGIWYDFKISIFTALIIVTSIILFKKIILLDLIIFEIIFLIAIIFSLFKEKIRSLEKLMVSKPLFDFLTGLPNRKTFELALSHALKDVQEKYLAVITLDLNGFTRINDSLGHDKGDKLLISVTSRLRRISGRYFLARSGNDEFIMKFTEESLKKILKWIEEILEVFKEPFQLEEEEIFLSASAGISIYPNDGDDYKSLIKNSEIALFNAKKTGKNFRFFSQEMNDENLKKMNLANNLWQEVKQNNCQNIFVSYQPIVDKENTKIEFIEALLRWKHPQHGFISPEHFINIAEETGLIIPLSEWLFSKICSDLKNWCKKGKEVTVSINLSAFQLEKDDFAEKILLLLKDNQISSQKIIFEITETVIMKNTEKISFMLEQLRKKGIRIALDDFGTGYSSLNYLAKLPIDILKLDRSIIRDFSDSKNKVIIESIISLAQKLNLKVCAEGVEKIEQQEYLKKNNCDYLQGFLFSKPLDKVALENTLDFYYK